MCVAGTTEHGHGAAVSDADGRDGAALSAHGAQRRALLKTGAAVAAGGALAALGPPLPALGSTGRPSGRVVDLTHRLVKGFATFLGDDDAINDEVSFDFDPAGFFAKTWTVFEHVGTHIDAPGHFSPGAMLVDDIPADQLIAPLVVIDIKRKVADDPNATVDPEDLLAYERRYGRIPKRALVAMNSGWSDLVDDNEEFRGGTGFPDLNFPGFSPDATAWLVRHRNPVGIAVDTMSLDPGNSADFAVHTTFLATNRYGVENVANLDRVRPRGARVFIGAIPWEDGSGGPCRVIAFR